MTDKNKLFSLLFLKAFLLIILIQSGYLSLAPDEAQYWTWSRHLDFGYYSKPPMIAWQIKLTTALFGNSELGVRIGAVIYGILLSWLLYKIGTLLKNPFWSGLTMAFSPLGIFLSFAATTDPGSIFFLTLALYFILKGPYFLLCGLCIAMGALYNWRVFFFWPLLLLGSIFFPILRNKRVVLAIAISLLALLPTLYWNATHDFATFRHVFETTAKATTGKNRGNFFDFLLAQIGLISPVFFVLMWISFFRRHQKWQLGFCALMAGATIFYYFLALFSKIQPNWALFLYPAGFAVMANYSHKRALHIGTWVSIALTALAMSIPFLQTQGFFNIPYKANPFRQNMGWKNLPKTLQAAGFQNEFLFSDKYQTVSLLSFYEKEAYFFNLSNQRKNQFSYLPQMSLEKGKNGYFVIAENVQEDNLQWYQEHYHKLLLPYFEQVEFKGNYPLFFANGQAVKYAIIFKGIGYNGQMPPEIQKY